MLNLFVLRLFLQCKCVFICKQLLLSVERTKKQKAASHFQLSSCRLSFSACPWASSVTCSLWRRGWSWSRDPVTSLRRTSARKCPAARDCCRSEAPHNAAFAPTQTTFSYLVLAFTVWDMLVHKRVSTFELLQLYRCYQVIYSQFTVNDLLISHFIQTHLSVESLSADSWPILTFPDQNQIDVHFLKPLHPFLVMGLLELILANAGTPRTSSPLQGDPITCRVDVDSPVNLWNMFLDCGGNQRKPTNVPGENANSLLLPKKKGPQQKQTWMLIRILLSSHPKTCWASWTQGFKKSLVGIVSCWFSLNHNVCLYSKLVIYRLV